jgi:hypothetical protein
MDKIEIKFWDTINKQFIIYQSWLSYNYHTGKIFDTHLAIYRYELIPIIYTCVNDRLNNKVWNKDIIECEYYPDLMTTKHLKHLIWRGVVFYNSYDGGFHVRRFTGLDEGSSLTYCVAFGGSAVKRWQVIGNELSHPELLKEDV